jgi:hypothetical protein
MNIREGQLRLTKSSHRAVVGIAAVAACAAVAAVNVGAAGADLPSTGLTGYTISMGASTTVPANSAGVSVAADAFCRPGKVVLSGGVVSHSHTTFIRTSYPTDSRTWQAVVTPTVNISYAETFQTYAICVDASSVPGYSQVQSAQLPVGPATYYGPNKAVGDKYCASGDVVVGGGVRSHNPSTFLTVSKPTSDQRAWEVEVHLTNPPSWGGEYYQVSAVCIPGTDLPAGGYNIVTATTSTYGVGLTQAAPTSAAGTPYCGAGQLSIAGGAINHDQDNGFISSVAPNASGKYWVVADTDVAPPSYGEHFLPVGICATATA